MRGTGEGSGMCSLGGVKENVIVYTVKKKRKEAEMHQSSIAHASQQRQKIEWLEVDMTCFAVLGAFIKGSSEKEMQEGLCSNAKYRQCVKVSV